MVPKAVQKWYKNLPKNGAPKKTNKNNFGPFWGTKMGPKILRPLRDGFETATPEELSLLVKILRILYVFIHFMDMPRYTFYVKIGAQLVKI